MNSLRALVARGARRPASQLCRNQLALTQFQRLQIPSRNQHLSVPRRWNSSLALSEADAELAAKQKQKHTVNEPSYFLSFRCKPCGTASKHYVTKHGYHKGTTLVTCPGCKSRHLISDHLKIFLDTKSTLEDILRQRLEEGEDLTKFLKKGKLGMRQGEMIAREGDEGIEFWEDGTTSTHDSSDAPRPTPRSDTTT